MKNTIYTALLSLVYLGLSAQETIYPAPAHQGVIALTGGTIHIGNGSIIENGTVVIRNSVIEAVGPNVSVPSGAKVISVSGKQVYPGLIAPSSSLGLTEIASVRALSDLNELGNYNPSVKTIMAYNAESKVIPTLRSNGVLLAQVTPGGGIFSGTSTVVQLDAWNWQDAAYKMNNGIHLNFPALVNRPGPFGGGGLQGRGSQSPDDALKAALTRVEEIRSFLREAKAYSKTPGPVNLKYEALKGLFNKSQKLFVHCDLAKEILMALDFKKEFDLDLVIEGGTDSWMVADILREHQVPVILSEPHNLPSMADDAVDQPYKTGYLLHKAGVPFTIAIDGFWQQRNLPFQAGTLAAYGLSKEEALTAVTLQAARILGIDKQTGSIEAGKDANIVVSEGDILDMKSNKVTHAFIQGRQINLDNKHNQLFEKYKYRYNLK